MKSYNMQSLISMMMMVVVLVKMIRIAETFPAHAAPPALRANSSINPKTILKEIMKEAEAMRDRSDTLNVSVIKIPCRNGTICVPDFFCLAEKVLLPQFPNETLTRLLGDYIRSDETQNEHCTLNSTARQALRVFLTHVIQCAKNKHLMARQ